MTKHLSTIGYIILFVIIVLGVMVYTKAHSTKVGSVTPSTSMLIEDYTPYVRTAGGINTNLPVSIGSDLTVSGGSINITSSNTATSSIIVGCIQFYATSTATALKFQASTTPGIMYSQYGTCPNL